MTRINDVMLNRDNMILLALVAGLFTLSFQLYVYGQSILTPLSIIFLHSPPYVSIFNQCVPITLLLLLLVWLKMEKLREKNRFVGLAMVIAMTASSVLTFLILFRVWDFTAMVAFPNYGNVLLEKWTPEVWMDLFFFCTLSLALFGFFTATYGSKGLKVMAFIAVIPAFYALNRDVIMYASQIQSFSVFIPVYEFIIEYGKLETLAVAGLLNAFGSRTIVNVATFPYMLTTGGALYSVDLPCIGWEGVIGYTIIFIAFISDLEVSRGMKIIWAVVGFFGTLFVNLLRLTLIFSVGTIWGVSAAELIHNNAGDIIFLAWILIFWLVVLRVSKRKPMP